MYLAPEILGVLRLAAAGFPRLAGLFDGSLSDQQEALLLALLPEGTRVVLVGAGFEASILGRLARSFSLRNLTSVPQQSDSDPSPEVACAL